MEASDALIRQYKHILDSYAAFGANPKQDALLEDDFDDALKRYVEAFNKHARHWAELQEFATNLSRGALKMDAPPRDNHMAAPIKNLHAQLRHLSWQAKQVTKGDYNQSIDFMGDFADSFNTMISQLAEREKRMISDHAILKNVLEMTPLAVIVADSNNEILFSNKSAKELLLDSRKDSRRKNDQRELLNMIFELLWEEGDNHEIRSPDGELYYDLKKSDIDWIDGRKARLCVLDDITATKLSELELMSLAFIDKASGVGNSNSERVNIQRLIDEKRNFSLVFIDMDLLKHINDTYGHNEGDFAIEALAKHLKSSIREKNLVFRHGGDEFVLIMLDCDAQTADKVMRRIRAAASSITKGKPFDILFSYGVYEHKGGTEESVDDILSKADERMYIDKRERRMERA